MIQYYDREKKEVIEEIEYEKEMLEFLYHTVLGRFLLKIFVARPWFSNLKSVWKKSRFSVKEIQPFVEKHKVQISEAEIKQFQSFNDFFTRPHAPILHQKQGELVAPADSKMCYYNISDNLQITVKSAQYTIADLLGDCRMASRFRNGTCIVYRLSADDNHHYYYIDEGKLLLRKKIAGELHTIRPFSEKYQVFTRNSREVSVLDMVHLGVVAQIEVGALLVGRIQNFDKTNFEKNEEKGFFEFGGSTIIVLVNKKIQFDEDIEKMNQNGYETKVFAGERVGIIC